MYSCYVEDPCNFSENFNVECLDFKCMLFNTTRFWNDQTLGKKLPSFWSEYSIGNVSFFIHNNYRLKTCIIQGAYFNYDVTIGSKLIVIQMRHLSIFIILFILRISMVLEGTKCTKVTWIINLTNFFKLLDPIFDLRYC